MIESIKKLFKLFSNRDKFFILRLFILMVLGSFLEVIGISAIPAFVILISDPEKISNYNFIKTVIDNLEITTPEQLLLWGSFTLLVIYIIKNLLLVYLEYSRYRFVYKGRVRLSKLLFSAYMNAPYTFHLQYNTAELLRNLNREVTLIFNNVLLQILLFTKNLLMICSIILLLLLVNPVITLFMIIMFGFISGWFLKIVNNRLKYYGKQEQDSSRSIIKNVNEGLGGLKEVRILNRESFFINKFAHNLNQLAKASFVKSIISYLPQPITEIIVVLCMLLITLILFAQNEEFSMIVPLLLLYGISSIRLIPSVKGLVSTITAIRYYIYSVDPVYNHLVELNNDLFHPKREQNISNTELCFYDKIEFKNLHYHYPGTNTQALKGIDLNIKKNSVVGFVGPTGAGKTTIIDLILGLLKPDKGSVSIDGVDINENLRGWQKKIGYIPQFIFLSDDKIMRNIAFGLDDDQIDSQKINNAIYAAQLKEFIDNLPDGINTVIGESGVRLSGGQRQRIGIARALYHSPEVLIMDEATASLDNVTEKHIIQAIESLRGDLTIIIIAHRLTTVRDCDQLFYIKDGLLESSGTYEELIKMNSAFKLMAEH